MTPEVAPLYLNGKFLAQRMTGVQRYAHGILRGLDEVLASAPETSQRVVLLSPHSAPSVSLRCIEQRTVGQRDASLHAWEQFTLPWQSRNGVLMSMAGSASLLHPRQILTLHDAAIYEHPEAYTRAFITWYRMLFAVCSRRSPLLVTSSIFSKSKLGSFLRRDENAISVIPGAADHITQYTADQSIIGRLALQPRRYWLAVGSANPTKNFARLVEAFDAVPRALGVQLVIVGGRNNDVFLGGTGPTPKDDRFVWTGPISDECLRTLYEHALGFVFPSLYEGFGLPPLEAMACGCPVAAAHAASIPEVCSDAALYFDPSSTAEITAALCRLTEDQALRADLITRGAQRASEFSWASSAVELLRELRERGLFA